MHQQCARHPALASQTCHPVLASRGPCLRPRHTAPRAARAVRPRHSTLRAAPRRACVHCARSVRHSGRPEAPLQARAQKARVAPCGALHTRDAFRVNQVIHCNAFRNSAIGFCIKSLNLPKSETYSEYATTYIRLNMIARGDSRRLQQHRLPAAHKQSDANE